jgi:hypothetical protein
MTSNCAVESNKVVFELPFMGIIRRRMNVLDADGGERAPPPRGPAIVNERNERWYILKCEDKPEVNTMRAEAVPKSVPYQ